VLLDVMMPTIDGYKMAKMIKAEAGSFVPVILLTALEDVESKRRGMASGADDFLSKPVSALELQIRIQSMLRIKHLTDELQEANAKLARLAITDPLTGLPNRRSLYEHLQREFQRAGRYRHPMSVVMSDIDHFKKVNDTWGHQIGDRVIRLVADVMRSLVRASDIAGRFGGEEFLLVAPETGREAVAPLCERIRSLVEREAARAGDGIPPVTISVGAASTDAVHVETVDELVHAADTALYEAKRAGRNRVVVSGAQSS
jgi:diguanylate cyclase (GGDEF)-like protein